MGARCSSTDYKFDLRLYVAVTSFEPLRAYIYDEGLARFSTVKYTNDHADQPSHLSNPFMHLTNYSINKKSSDFVPNQDASQDGEGTKWSLSALRRRLAQSGIDVPALFAKIDALVLKTLIAVEPSVVAATRRYCHHRNSCFEMVGFDVLIDENLKPWLIEVNLSPSLAADSPIDLKLKTQMLASLFTLVGLRPYDRSQHRRAQQKKQAERWNRMARGEPGARIRSTPADLLRSPEAMRAVVELDDEEAKCGNWKRIFPVAHGHTYRRLFAQERPMNSLLVDVLIARRKAARRADPTPADPVGAARRCRRRRRRHRRRRHRRRRRDRRAPSHRQAAHPDAPAVDVVGDVAAVVVVCVVLSSSPTRSASRVQAAGAADERRHAARAP